MERQQTVDRASVLTSENVRRWPYRSILEEGLPPIWITDARLTYRGQPTLSGRRPIVVVQHAAQSLPLLYRTARSQVTRLGKNDSISQPLMVSFAMMVRHEISDGRLERPLSKQNHPVQAGFLDASYKSLRIRVYMSAQMHRMEA